MEEHSIYLKCKIEKNGKIGNCKRVNKKCRDYKETGFGISGPIANYKRVCEISNLKDFVTKW